jgi:hypothetical protein
MGLSRRRNKIKLDMGFVKDFEEAIAEAHFLFIWRKDSSLRVSNNPWRRVRLQV